MPSRSLGTIQKIVRSIENAPDLTAALNSLVSKIHDILEVDVCSIYLTDTHNDTNILMASYGLNPESIGKVIIPINEGLVGLVTQLSKPVNIHDAQTHPRFKYIPESGEEPFHSFLGVPVTHHGEQLAVLVVQRAEIRRFDEQDLAFLSTLAALIAGNIALARARGQIQEFFATEKLSGSVFAGVAGAYGICIGTGVVIYRQRDILQVPDRTPKDMELEISRFRQAIETVIRESENIGNQLGSTLPETDKMVFNAYALIAGSDELVNETIKFIRAGNWAPGALRKTIKTYAESFEALDDPYMRERANDIINIGQHVLEYLLMDDQQEIDYPENTVLVGENLSPIDMGKVPMDRLKGIVNGHGSAYSHLAILAHALGLPAVLGFSGQVPLERLDSKSIIVDGYQGQIIVTPDDNQIHEYSNLIRQEKELGTKLSSLKDEPAVTTDGVVIHLYTNTGLMAGHSHIFEVGTEGIGLYRSEFPFMNRESFPGEEEQRSLYREVIQTYSPMPVTLRTLDAGGDKILPYLNVMEPNPFLGWRGIRVVLDHPEILLTQVRAMLRASYGYNNLRILLPMISTVEELDRSLALIRQAYNDVIEEYGSVPFPPVGAMIEVPSAIAQIESIINKVDFLSIGTNDLIQYMLAIDRNNERVAKMFNPLHPTILKALEYICVTAKKHNKPVSICGEAAGDPALVVLLIAMRVDSLSLSAGDLPRMKWVIRSFSHARASEIWQQVREMEYVNQIRELLHGELEKAGLGGLLRAGG